MYQLKGLTQKMQVFIVCRGHDKIAGQEPDSPHFIVTTIQTSLETGSVSYLFAAGTVSHFSLPDFISSLNSSTFCLTDFPPPCPPGLNLAQGVLGPLECPETRHKASGLRCWEVRPARRCRMRSRLGSGKFQRSAGLQIASPARTAPLLWKCDTC